MEEIIRINHITKEFRVPDRHEGLKGSIRAVVALASDQRSVLLPRVQVLDVRRFPVQQHRIVNRLTLFAAYL